MTRLCFLDCETTSLNSDTGEVWEIGLIVRESEDTEYCWQIRPDLSTADPMSLRVGRYFERIWSPSAEAGSAWRVTHPGGYGNTTASDVAFDIADLLNGAHVVGCVPDFDARFLRRFLARNSYCFTAHYHLIDVENLAVGYLVAKGEPLSPPWDSEVISAKLGVDPSKYERHTALGDARWARDLYDAVMGGGHRG